MGVLFILVGFAVAVFGARTFIKPEFLRAIVFQGPLGGLVILIIQLTRWVLVIYGLVRLFNDFVQILQNAPFPWVKFL